MEELTEMKIISGQSEEDGQNNLDEQKYEYLNEDKAKEKKFNIFPVKDCYKIKKEKYNYYIKRMKKFGMNLFAVYGFFLLYSYYNLSLEKCNDGIAECVRKLDWIMEKIKEEIISCILGAIMLQLIMFNLISKIHLIHSIIIFKNLYLKSHGFEFDDHGYFNFLYFFILLSIITLTLLPLDCILCCNKKRHFTIKLLIIIVYFGILFIVGYFNYDLFKYTSDCNDWIQGLNNTSIENNKTKYGCQIQVPK